MKNTQIESLFVKPKEKKQEYSYVEKDILGLLSYKDFVKIKRIIAALTEEQDHALSDVEAGIHSLIEKGAVIKWQNGLKKKFTTEV